MLTYIQRIRVYVAVIVVLVVIVSISFNISAYAKLADIRVLNETRTLSTIFERYRQDFLRYPVGNKIDLRKNFVLSENGFIPGDSYYNVSRIQSSRAVMYTGTEDSYTISFSLKQEWSDQGITGRKCRISEKSILTCE